MTEITAEGRVSATTTTVTDNKNGTILKPSANVPKKSVADDLVSTFSSPTVWLLVVALIVTWSAVAVVMFDLTDYKSYVGGITKLGSDPMKVIDEVVEVSTNWIHGAMSLLSDMITPDDDDDEGETEHPLKRRGEAHPSKQKVMNKNTKETNERKSRDVKKAPLKEARKVKVTKAEEKTKKAAKPEKKVERAKKEIKEVEKAKPKAKSKEETPSKTESKDQFEFCRYVVDLYTHEDVSSGVETAPGLPKGSSTPKKRAAPAVEERKPVVKPVQVKKEEPKKKPSQEPRKKLNPEIERSAKDKPKAGTSTAKPKAQKAAPPSAKEPVEKKPAAKPKETKSKPEKVVKKEVRTQKEKVPVHVENEKSKAKGKKTAKSEVVKEKASPSPTKKAQKEKTKTAKPEVEKQKSRPAQTKKVSQAKKEVKSSKAAEPVKALKTEEHKESKREKEKEKPAAVPRGKEPEAIKDEKSAKTEEKVQEVKPLPRAAEAKPTRSHPPTKTPPPTKAPLPKKLAEAEKTHAKEEKVKDLKSLKPTSSMPYFQCIFVDGSNGYSFTHMQSLSVIPKSSEKKTQSPGQ
ncbi:triadin-like isoform X3 [Acipenser ruthenus]|uniref:triadin-like isoform X3 n=1 Tax=Acipenser ruthenus TaxID=7906 RepID=UPI002741596C|nr:triadin-like isoform X3 [Acipenser ruthenus]